MGVGGGGMSRNMLFLKNPRVRTDAPLPGRLGGAHDTAASGAGPSARARRGPRPGRGPAPLCARAPGGPLAGADGHAHSRGGRVQPGAPRADGRWRFNTAPPRGTWAPFFFPLPPFFYGKDAHPRPERSARSLPRPRSSVSSFPPWGSPPPWGSQPPRGGFGRARPRAPAFGRPAPPRAEAGVTVSGPGPGPGPSPRLPSGHCRRRF